MGVAEGKGWGICSMPSRHSFGMPPPGWEVATGAGRAGHGGKSPVKWGNIQIHAAFD